MSVTQSAELLQVVLEAADGIVCVGEDGKVTFANRAAERIFRCGPGEITGTHFSDLIESGDEVLDLALRGDGLRTLRATARRPDGVEIPLEISVARHDLGGHPYASAVVRDLSASDRSLGAHEQAAERQAFLSMAAHELRAPIQPIITSLRTIERAMARGVALPGDTIPRALRQTLRLGRLVDHILKDIAALDSGTLAITVGSFDLGNLADDLVHDFRAAAPDQEIALRRPEEPVILLSDESRVQQILMSLLDNALKYSTPRASVEVDVEADPERARVRVSDRGIGIPIAELDSVFEKFVRGSNVESFSGLGVGLYLARGIAVRLGGELSVASAEGHGSVFTLTLPRRCPSPIAGGDLRS